MKSKVISGREGTALSMCHGASNISIAGIMKAPSVFANTVIARLSPTQARRAAQWLLVAADAIDGGVGRG